MLINEDLLADKVEGILMSHLKNTMALRYGLRREECVVRRS